MSKLSSWGLIVLLGCGDGISAERVPSEHYEGEIEAGRLADGVAEIEPSHLRVDFLTCDGGGQCAEVDFDGTLSVIGIEIPDNPPQTVDNVMIDGTALICEADADGYLLRIEGVFSTDRSTLDVSVSDILVWSEIFLGSILLTRVDPEPDTGGDTATPPDTGDSAN